MAQAHPLPTTDWQTGREEWDAYVRQAKGALYSHLWDWGETLSQVYDLPLLRLSVRQSETGRLAGVLPLALFAPPAGEKRLISLPYTDAAGIVTDDQQAASALLTSALDCLGQTQSCHLELRQEGASRELPTGAMGVTSTSHTFKTGLVRELPDSEEALWAGLDAKVRNQVRKSGREGCVATVGGSELVEEFFSVFSENMRDLGSPVHDPQLFRAMSQRVPGAIVLVRCQGLPVAAAMVFMHAGVLYNPWASSLRRFRPLCPNMLLYWSMLVHGVQCGCHAFNFGRSSPGAPACRFKEQWGAIRQPLTWQVISGAGSQWDPGNESLVNEEFKPLDLETSRRLGPAARRWISL
jgi:FemAB-related protein (PEP-CTERM system-associated)